MATKLDLKLLVPGTLWYADDSTDVDRYLASAHAGRDDIVSREAIVKHLNVALQAVSDCGDANLVTSKLPKLACLFSTKRSLIHLAPTFRGVSVPLTDSLTAPQCGAFIHPELCAIYRLYT